MRPDLGLMLELSLVFALVLGLVFVFCFFISSCGNHRKESELFFMAKFEISF